MKSEATDAHEWRFAGELAFEKLSTMVKITNVVPTANPFAPSQCDERSLIRGHVDGQYPADRVEIVGLCKDAKYDRLRADIPPTVYVSYWQASDSEGGMTFELRTAMPPMTIAGAVHPKKVDPTVLGIAYGPETGSG